MDDDTKRAIAAGFLFLVILALIGWVDESASFLLEILSYMP